MFASSKSLLLRTSIQRKTLHTASKVSFEGIDHFITLRDLSPAQILHLVKRSMELKQQVLSGQPSVDQPLKGKTLAMIFSKRSTRTRVSSESGWAYFGGHPMFLGMNDIQVGGGEPWQDTSIVISSMVDAILARLGAHSEIELLAKYSSVPVINALTAKFHPLQILADLQTIYEAFPQKAIQSENLPLPLFKGLKVAWVGDGNNILHSMLVSMPRLGIDVAAATPRGYEPEEDVVDFAKANSGKGSWGKVSLTHDAREAVHDADVIVTDTWVSMGQEAEKAKRLKDFAGYQVTEQMAKEAGAKPGWKFMHCLPRKQEEVDDATFYNPQRSLVWTEAQCRKWTVMSVYEAMMIK